jgi:UMF1 family MFS transporter
MALLILANIGFEAGLVFYDSFLPEITTERSYGRVSGYGFAMGYVGSLLTLLIALPLYQGGFEPGNLPSVRMSFLLAAGMFLVFSLPLFLFVPDRQRNAPLKFNFLAIGLERVRSTFREFSKYKSVARFLVAYFLYIDAVNTIIVFSSMGEIILFFAIVQSSAVAGSLLFGVLADKIGHKRSLVISLYLWLVILVLAYFVMDKTAFFGIGILAGVALGSSQSASRSLMSSLVPLEKKTEFFGFYSFFGKASAIIGPVLFGVVSSNVNQRAALLAVSVLLIAGMFLLRRVESR